MKFLRFSLSTVLFLLFGVHCGMAMVPKPFCRFSGTGQNHNTSEQWTSNNPGFGIQAVTRGQRYNPRVIVAYLDDDKINARLAAEKAAAAKEKAATDQQKAQAGSALKAREAEEAETARLKKAEQGAREAAEEERKAKETEEANRVAAKQTAQMEHRQNYKKERIERKQAEKEKSEGLREGRVALAQIYAQRAQASNPKQRTSKKTTQKTKDSSQKIASTPNASKKSETKAPQTQPTVEPTSQVSNSATPLTQAPQQQIIDDEDDESEHKASSHRPTNLISDALERTQQSFSQFARNVAQDFARSMLEQAADAALGTFMGRNAEEQQPNPNNHPTAFGQPVANYSFFGPQVAHNNFFENPLPRSSSPTSWGANRIPPRKVSTTNEEATTAEDNDHGSGLTQPITSTAPLHTSTTPPATSTDSANAAVVNATTKAATTQATAIAPATIITDDASTLDLDGKDIKISRENSDDKADGSTTMLELGNFSYRDINNIAKELKARQDSANAYIQQNGNDPYLVAVNKMAQGINAMCAFMDKHNAKERSLAFMEVSQRIWQAGQRIAGYLNVMKRGLGRCSRECKQETDALVDTVLQKPQALVINTCVNIADCVEQVTLFGVKVLFLAAGNPELLQRTIAEWCKEAATQASQLTPERALENSVYLVSKVICSTLVPAIPFGSLSNAALALSYVNSLMDAGAQSVQALRACTWVPEEVKNAANMQNIFNEYAQALQTAGRYGLEKVKRAVAIYEKNREFIPRTGPVVTEIAKIAEIETAIEQEKAIPTLLEMAKKAKPMKQAPHQVEYLLKDKTRVVFRRDIGEHAHAISNHGYKTPVDHYNIEVQRPIKTHRMDRIGYEPIYTNHIIVDSNYNIIERF